MNIDDIHIFQCFNQLIGGNVGILILKSAFEQSINEKSGVTDQKMGTYSFRFSVIDGTAVKMCFHHSKTIFNLISLLSNVQDGFCIILKIGSNGIISIMRV